MRSSTLGSAELWDWEFEVQRLAVISNRPQPGTLKYCAATYSHVYKASTTNSITLHLFILFALVCPLEGDLNPKP